MNDSYIVTNRLVTNSNKYNLNYTQIWTLTNFIAGIFRVFCIYLIIIFFRVYSPLWLAICKRVSTVCKLVGYSITSECGGLRHLLGGAMNGTLSAKVKRWKKVGIVKDGEVSKVKYAMYGVGLTLA
jgi:hypothetical protein